MKHNIIHSFLLSISVLLIILTSSCQQVPAIDSEDQENSDIATYVQTHAIKTLPSASGLYNIPLASGPSDGLAVTKTTDFVLFDYIALNINDKVYDSSIPAIAAAHKDSFPLLKFGGPRLIQMDIYKSPYGLVEGFGKMKEGDSAEFIIPSKLWSTDYNTRIYLVKLKKVIPDIQAYEHLQIKNFLDTCLSNVNPKLTLNDSTTTPETVTGIYYIETLKGDGLNVPATGDSINVTYAVNTIDGKFFDTGANFKSRVGMNLLIPGFEEGIKHMKAGGKAIIIIPYRQAYGGTDQLDPVTGQIILQSYSTIVFYVTLNSIKKI